MDSEQLTKPRFDTICCSNCRRELGAVISGINPESEPRTTTLTVTCPFCNDKSFKRSIVGKYSFGEQEGLIKYHVSGEDDDFIIYLKRA